MSTVLSTISPYLTSRNRGIDNDPDLFSILVRTDVTPGNPEWSEYIGFPPHLWNLAPCLDFSTFYLNFIWRNHLPLDSSSAKEILGIRMRYGNCAKTHSKKTQSGNLYSKIARRKIFILGPWTSSPIDGRCLISHSTRSLKNQLGKIGFTKKMES